MNWFKIYEKLILTVFTFLVWALCYHQINSLSPVGKIHILALPFEKYIPFVPFFVRFYFLVYLIVFAPIFILKDIRDFRKAVLAYLFVILISSLISLVYPVEIQRPDVIPNTFFLWLVSLLYRFGKPYALFPSLHVSEAILTMFICLRFNKKVGYILVLVVTLIISSTLYLKQHYILDLIAAGIISSRVYYVIFKKGILNRFAYFKTEKKS